MDEALALAIYRGIDALTTIAPSRSVPVATALSLEEDARISFELTPRIPGREYRVMVGDSVFEPALSGRRAIEWGDQTLYFDSARGPTRLVLQEKHADVEAAWQDVLNCDFLITPTKLNATAFDRMVEDLAKLASGLVFDLMAKSTVRINPVSGREATGISTHSPQAELGLLTRIWDRLSVALGTVLQQPESRLTRKQELRACQGHEAFSQMELVRLANRGIDLRRKETVRPFSASVDIISNSNDILENRIILRFLRLLANRTRACQLRAREQIDQMNERVQHWLDAGAKSEVFEYERPHREKLEGACDAAEGLLTKIASAIRGFGPLSDYQFERGIPETPVFLNISHYHHIWMVMRQYLSQTVVSLETGSEERLKQTWRMYEQWVFLQLAEALRTSGLLCENTVDFLSALSRRRFAIDLQRDSFLEFRNSDGLKVVLTYEPTVFRKEVAAKAGARIYSGIASDQPLAPDVLIEVLRQMPDGNYDLVYAIVVDAKYSRNPSRYIEQCSKYQKIRHAGTDRSVVRQIWIAAPVDEGITPEDSAVVWTDDGPLVEMGEFVAGHFGMMPVTDDIDDGNLLNSGAKRLILGLLSHLGENFTQAPRKAVI